MPPKKNSNLDVIGITDVINIPSSGIVNLPCKIDTGADTSTIHCERVKIKEIDGVEHLVFQLLDRKHPLYTGEELQVSEFKEMKVKSSFGDYEFRYRVKLVFELKGKTYKGIFNLSNRKNMKYPVLLGRKFLAKKFIVDVTIRNPSIK